MFRLTGVYIRRATDIMVYDPRFPRTIRSSQGATTIKGPMQRIHLDVRRIWRCPECRRIVKTVGTVVSKRCHCKPESVWMQVVPRPVRKFEIHDTYKLEEIEDDTLEEDEVVVVADHEETPESPETTSEDLAKSSHVVKDEVTDESGSDTPQDEPSQDNDDSNEGFDLGIFED